MCEKDVEEEGGGVVSLWGGERGERERGRDRERERGG